MQGFTICESFVQAIQFVNVVGKQCMELNVMGKTCVETRFVNICECSGQDMCGDEIVNICECSGQEI